MTPLLVQAESALLDEFLEEDPQPLAVRDRRIARHDIDARVGLTVSARLELLERHRVRANGPIRPILLAVIRTARGRAEEQERNRYTNSTTDGPHLRNPPKHEVNESDQGGARPRGRGLPSCPARAPFGESSSRRGALF